VDNGFVTFVKGHGTENDFVLLPDPGDRLDLRPELVRALCDRRAGIGADGVLRVVPAPEGSGARWFMDYRNADGSIAEMCGNGVRVYARYLVDAGMAEPGELMLATRGGLRAVRVPETGDVTVDMGTPQLLTDSPVVGGRPGVAISMGNPHVVVRVDDEDALDALDLSSPPVVEPALPDGQNVEFVVRSDRRCLTMRVHERGVGETRSCGTGVCAAVVATVAGDGAGRGDEFQVQVPGGVLAVSWRTDGTVLLRGPAVLVGSGRLSAAWLRQAGHTSPSTDSSSGSAPVGSGSVGSGSVGSGS
jgi:diaminopimelate epimerase